MKIITVSIIMTIYNGEDKCYKMLDSILKQDYYNYEVICVNDGSVDNTDIVLNQYEKKDNRVKVYKTKNQGSANARLYGLNKSCGEYVIFLDCDDTIEENMISLMMDNANNNKSDMVVCGYDRTYENENTPFSFEFCEPREDISLSNNNKLDIAFINTALWNKLIKRSCISNDIKMPRITQADDLSFLINIYNNISKVTYLPKCLIHYIVNKDGLMSSTSVDNFLILQNYIAKIAKKADFEYKNIICAMSFICLANSYIPRINQTADNKTKKYVIKITREFFFNNFKEYYKYGVFKLKNAKRYKVKGVGLFLSGLFFRFNLFSFYLFMFKYARKFLKINF